MSGKDCNWVIDTLNDLKIEYRLEKGTFFFKYRDIDFWINNEGKIGVSEYYYGRIPHVMNNGAVCVSGNINILVDEKRTTLLKKSITMYVPWLFSLPPEYKVAEFLSELDFFINDFLDCKCSISKSAYLPDVFCDEAILNPGDLWMKISNMDKNQWYKYYPVNLSNYYVFIRKTQNKKFEINYDEFSRARMRVSGDKYNENFKSTMFIGVGSVNSYIIKKLTSFGLNELTLVDNDVVEVGNMYRFAFPHLGVKKTIAAKNFIKKVFGNAKVEIVNARITSDSENIINNIESIYVSVDNFNSWVDIISYLHTYAKSGTEINLCGVDAFGGYGKLIKIRFDGSNPEQFIKQALEFLEAPGIEKIRKQMIGNGCGKSIAIYNEENLLKLARKVCENSKEGEVIYVSF